ncbi:hypothetical protein EKK58_07130 [Candidatus Dependentiae bacterium]|nr:MAG: hypothetical protein EKK58_07130 [Candidatus Dependentiae bacterium]
MVNLFFAFFLLTSSSTFPMCNPCSWMYNFVAIPWDKLTDASIQKSKSLYEAIQKNDFELFKTLIESGATFKYKAEDGNSIMHELVKPANIEYLNYVHQKGLLFSSKKNAPSFWPNERGYANVEIKDNDGNTPLHDACQFGNIKAIALLMDYQVPLFTPNNDGDVPLFKSIQYQHTIILPDNTAILKYFKDHSTPEEWQKVCTEHQNKQGNSLIHIICKKGNVDQAKYILDAFPHVLNQKDIDEQTPLHFAIIYNENDEIVNFLLTCKNLDVTAKNITDDTAAMYALYKNKIDAFKKIIAYDKKVINIPNHDGQTPLHYLIKFRENIAPLAYFLIEHGANLNIKDKDGNTPLHYAVMQQDEKLVDLIIKKNPALEKITNNNNETPFQIACNQQWKGGKEYFLTHLPKENQYLTDLFKTKKIDYTLCEKILQQNAELAYTKDDQGNCPLLIATKKQDVKGIKLLLQYAPGTANIVNTNKDTPLHVILSNQEIKNTDINKEIIDLLLCHTHLIDQSTSNLVRNDQGDSLLDLALNDTKLSIEILNKLPDKAKAINEPNPKTGFSPFLTACKNGNYELVTLFAAGDKANLEQRVQQSNSSFNGYTPLLLAGVGGHKKIYDFLIVQGCNQNVYGADGWNIAIGLIVNYNNLDSQGAELKRIIKIYPEMAFKKTETGSNLLHFAIRFHNKNAYTLLAQEYSSLIHEQDNNGNSPVDYAIEAQNTHALMIMKPTKHMPKIDTKNYLFAALKTKNIDIIELFATPELVNKPHTKDSITPLQYALQNNYDNKKHIELLIKRGADPKVKSPNNQNTLEMCLKYGNHDIFDLLLQSFSPSEFLSLTHKTLTLKDTYFFEKLLEKMSSVDRTVFFRQPIENKNCFLEYAINNKLTDQITVALKKGLNINEHFPNGTLPLHYAIKNGHRQICKLLLDHKASPLDTDNQGYNALMLSIVNKQDDITIDLLTKPCNIAQKTTDGKSVLHLAAEYSKYDILKKIVQKYPHVNEQDQQGNTPLHRAAEQGNIDNVNLLLNYNANVHIPNNAGWDILTIIKNAKNHASYFDQYQYDSIYTLIHNKIEQTEKAQKEVDDLYTSVTLLKQQNNMLVNTIKKCDPTLWNSTIYTPTSFVYPIAPQKEKTSADDLKRIKEDLEKQKTKEEQYKKVLQDLWQQKCQLYYYQQQPMTRSEVHHVTEPSAPPMTQEDFQAYQDELNKAYQDQQPQQQDWQQAQNQYWQNQNQ